MASELDHDRIREVEDRGATATLLELVRAPDTPEEERAAAFASLRAIEDHRSVEPLLAMLEDVSLPAELRRSAAAVLDSIDDTSTISQRAAWWESGDDILRAHALGQMGRFEAEIVIPVASDDSHPLQAEALEAMAFDFDEPEFSPVLIRALAHPDDKVRYAAADALVWGEPQAAELPLLAAASDPDAEVAEAALYALEYYPSRRVLRALAELEPHEDEDVRERAEWTLESLQTMFEAAGEGLSAGARASLAKWMAPVADLVDWPEVEAGDEDEPESPSIPRGPVSLPMPAYEIQAMLSDPDGEWAARLKLLRQVDWGSHSEEERQALRTEFDQHPDPDIRMMAAGAYLAWGDRDALVLQMLDDSETVRKTATWRLGDLPKDEALAPILWARMLGSSGTAAGEALAAYAAHADRDEAIPRMVELARSEPRESVRARAIGCLQEFEARAALEGLADGLREPPAFTWGPHLALLWAYDKLGIAAPDLTDLRDIDDLHVAEACARAHDTMVADHD